MIKYFGFCIVGQSAPGKIFCQIAACYFQKKEVD